MSIAKEVFRQQWENSIKNLEYEVTHCTDYEIFPLFQKYIKKDSYILENGCGLGRWVHFYSRLGYNICGLDWDEKIIKLINEQFPELKVYHGDSRQTNFEDNTFDVILSLGTFEHSEEGPEMAIKESIRILKNGGILICSMPYFSPLLKLKVAMKEVYRMFRYYSIFMNYKRYKKQLIKKFNHVYPSIMIKNNSDPNFFEYYFSHKYFLSLFSIPNTDILEHYTSFGIDGLFFVFKKIVGVWDYKECKVKLNPLGTILYKILPNQLYNLHNIIVIKKVQ